MCDKYTKLIILLVACLCLLVACSGTDGESEEDEENPGQEEAQPEDSEENPGQEEGREKVECDFSSQESAQCPDGWVCEYEHLEGRESTQNTFCHKTCQSDDDCYAERPNCSPEISWGSYVCSEADYRPRRCDPEATGSDCECGVSDDSAFLVEGTGEDCEIIESGVTACFEQAMTCLNACQDEFYRYDLGNGQAIIALGLQGSISPGWESNGQGSTSPNSCPAIDLWDEGG